MCLAFYSNYKVSLFSHQPKSFSLQTILKNLTKLIQLKSNKMNLIKKTLWLIAILFITNSTFAQTSYKEMMYDFNYNFYEVVEAAEKHFENNPTGKGSGFKQYMRWKNENEGKYSPSGDRVNVDHYISIKTLEKFAKENKNAAYKTNQVNAWEELGPYSSFTQDGNVRGIGRMECFWVNPDDPMELFIGSKSGGFWKTNDGGETWKNTTDFLAASGVNTITVNPFNQNEILINVQTARNHGTLGFYRSKDRGDTWLMTNFNFSTLSNSGEITRSKINIIKYHPKIKDLVFIGTINGIISSSDNLETWTDRQFAGESIIDIEFHPTSNHIIYASSSSHNTIFRSTDSGQNFFELDPITESNTKGQIAVSPAKPNNIWFASIDGIWKSTNKGADFDFVTNPDGGAWSFAVSDVDETKQIYGGVRVYASKDNERTFVKSSGYEYAKNVHADLRTAECVNGVFYIGTDGFFSKSEDNGETWTRLNENKSGKKGKGTGIRENYSLSVCQGINGVMMSGSQDNGTTIYNNNQWLEYSGADGMESVIHPLNEKWMLGSSQQGGRHVTKNGGVFPHHYVYHNSGAWEAPIFFDPNNHMKLYNFTEDLHVSYDFENNWDYVSSPEMGYIRRADIAHNNSDLIVVTSDSEIKLSTDKGETWKIITNNLAFSNNLKIYGISDITFNPKNDHTIIVTSNSHISGESKVFITKDLGETWSSIAYNIGSLPLRDVAIDHTDENNIYVGSEVGVMTKPMDGTVWTWYGKNLPNVTVSELKINHGTNELYAGTWGRGFWKTDLVGRSNYPKILTTRLTDTPTEITPQVGSNQMVTCTIDYAASLSNVDVRWSLNNRSFSNTINMTYSSANNTWVSDRALPATNPGDKVYFKVFATGSNNEVSETYKFMYEVRDACDSEILDQTEEDLEEPNTLLLLPFNSSLNGIGGERPTASSGLAYTAGKHNRAVYVYESSRAVSLKYAADNNIDAQKGTIEAWIKPKWNGNDGKSHTLIQYGVRGGLLILKDGANNLRLILNRFSPSGFPEIGVSKNIGDWQANQWKHVAFTWGDGQLQLFINGYLVSQKNYTVPIYPIADSDFNIGTDNGGLDWKGVIDHLRISNNIRTQIELIYFQNNCVKPKLAHQASTEIFNFPNPFTKQTTISYTLAKESPVTLTVYDGMGKQVVKLTEHETKQAGTHLINFNGKNYPSGIYYYTLQAGNYIETRKMILMR